MKKKLTVIVLLLLSFSLFAAPGGGPGGGGRGGPGGGAGGASRGGPGSNPGSNTGRNPGSNPGSAPGSKPAGGTGPERPAEGSGGTEPSKEPEKKDDFNPENVTNFRGVRLELSDKEPAVLKTSVKESSGNKITVSLYFNQTIKSETITPQNIYVNGKPLDNSTKIKFNRRADNCSFEVPEAKIENIEIKNLEGYNGKITESIKVEYEKNSDY